MLDVIFNDEWIISQNSMDAKKLFHFSSTVHAYIVEDWVWNKKKIIAHRSTVVVDAKIREMEENFMSKRTTKSPGKLHKENMPKILKNKLYLLRLYFFRSRFLLYIFTNTCRAAKCKFFFFYVKTKQKIWGQMNLLIIMQRENQRISFLSLKQNHKKIFSGLHFYDFIFNATAHHKYISFLWQN